VKEEQVTAENTVEVREAPEVLQRINTYHQYQRREGIPVITGFSVDALGELELAPWARKGGRGTFINLDGTAGTNDAYLCEIPPGGSTNPGRQLFEEMIYVLDGNGSTQVWYDEGKKVSFEWNQGSLFAIPLNAWHRHFNGRGNRPARYLAVTNAPLVMNLFHNLDFVFDSTFRFDDRFAGQHDYFSAEGQLYTGPAKRTRILEASFIPDVNNVQVYTWKERGGGGSTVEFELAHNTMAAHVSQFAVGNYKKSHRHGPGAHVIILSGQGYSLLWPQRDAEPRRVDWTVGSMVVPPNFWFHQHFNSGATPARYLALRWGSKRYDLGGAIQAGEEDLDVNVNEGGHQIEYEDEDRRVHEDFEAELARAGAVCRMRALVPWCTGV
jgi:oxalate decarboxylase/phosphoglucose isomerase-like protein (cupin superfamily)